MTLATIRDIRYAIAARYIDDCGTALLLSGVRARDDMREAGIRIGTLQPVDTAAYLRGPLLPMDAFGDWAARAAR